MSSTTKIRTASLIAAVLMTIVINGSMLWGFDSMAQGAVVHGVAA